MTNGAPPTFPRHRPKTHQAYPFWTGEEWKQGSKKRAAIKFPLFDEMRDGGRLCPDGQWRYVITMEDAIAGGFNLANIEAAQPLQHRHVRHALRVRVRGQ